MGGIGEAISIRLHDVGHAVVVTYSPSNSGADDWLARMEASGRQFRAYPVDVADYDSCQRCAAQIQAEVGPIDILVNNAGITRDAVLHRMTPEQWGAVIATNLTSCFNMCRLVIEGMRERGFGRIVNIGSINGQAGQYGQVNYAAAKSGIHGFTKALAQEGAGRGITVNAIAPGYIDTDMVRAVPANVLEKIVARIPVGRLGRANEIARGVLFLVSDDGGFVTGSTLSINGGQHMY
jgi:acetoacetyl-CoA reductase